MRDAAITVAHRMQEPVYETACATWCSSRAVRQWGYCAGRKTTFPVMHGGSRCVLKLTVRSVLFSTPILEIQHANVFCEKLHSRVMKQNTAITTTMHFVCHIPDVRRLHTCLRACYQLPLIINFIKTITYRDCPARCQSRFWGSQRLCLHQGNQKRARKPVYRRRPCWYGTQNIQCRHLRFIFNMVPRICPALKQKYNTFCKTVFACPALGIYVWNSKFKSHANCAGPYDFDSCKRLSLRTLHPAPQPTSSLWIHALPLPVHYYSHAGNSGM